MVYSKKAIKPVSNLPFVCFTAQKTLLFLLYIRKEYNEFKFDFSLHKKPVSPQL